MEPSRDPPTVEHGQDKLKYDVLLFDGAGTIALFKKRNYKVVVRVGTSETDAKEVTAILDTGAGPNLASKELLERSWLPRIRPTTDPGLTAATRQRIHVDGKILLTVRLGDLTARVYFGIVERLAVPLLLGTSFIDRFIDGVFPRTRQVVPIHSRPVAIVRAPLPPTPVRQTGPTTVRVAQQRQIPAGTRVWAPVTTTSSGPM